MQHAIKAKMAGEAQDATTNHAQSIANGITNVSRRRGAAVRGASPVEHEELQKLVQSPEEKVDVSRAVTPRPNDRVVDFLETVEVQAAIIALIAFDLVSTVVSLLLRSHYEILRFQSLVERSSSSTKPGSGMNVDVTLATTASPSVPIGLILRLLDSLAGFTIVLFVIELAILAFTFRRRFVAHVGYATDLVVVGLSIAVEIYIESNVGRLLGILRVWRVFRLVGTLLEREHNDHERTRDELAIEKTRVLHLQYEKQAAEQSLKRELESRPGVERMLQGYKDEADTLREALKIAAQAVAEATMLPPSIPEEIQESNVQEDEVTGSYQDWGYDTTYAAGEGYSQMTTADSEEAVTTEQSVQPDATLVIHDDEDDDEFADAQADDD